MDATELGWVRPVTRSCFGTALESCELVAHTRFRWPGELKH